MARLRNIERTLDTLKRLDPDHYQVVLKAIGVRGNQQPSQPRQNIERDGTHGKTKRMWK